MSVIYIELENEIPDFDSYVNGRGLARSEEQLSQLAKSKSLTPLMEFFGVSPDEFYELGGKPGEVSEEDLEANNLWFNPEDGLSTVEALLAAIVETPKAVENPEQVVSELEEWKVVLQHAISNSTRWRVAVDY